MRRQTWPLGHQGGVDIDYLLQTRLCQLPDNRLQQFQRISIAPGFLCGRKMVTYIAQRCRAK